MSKRRSARRELKREWERRGYSTDESTGHGRVRDAAGRLVATYARTPGSPRSASADWRKLDAPTPHGIDRASRERAPAELEADVGGGEVHRRPRDRRREKIPYEPTGRRPLVHGFDFPDFEMPTPRAANPAKVTAAKGRRRVRTWERTATNRVCDICIEESGPDTLIAVMDGPRERRVDWFMRRAQEIDRSIAARMADRITQFVQLCPSCWEEMKLPTGRYAMTYRQLAELAASADDDTPVPMFIIDADDDAPEVPPAFRRA